MSINVTMGGKLLFPSEYLCAADLKEQGAVATIDRVEAADLRMTDGKTARKFIVYFKGQGKKLVLNKTNARTIGMLHGGAVEAWRGKRITLFPTTCPSFGKIVACVRVGDQSPDAPRQAPEVLNGFHHEEFEDEPSSPAPPPETHAGTSPPTETAAAGSSKADTNAAKAAWIEFVEQIEAVASQNQLPPSQLTKGIGKFVLALGLKGREHEIPADKRDELMKSVKGGDGYFAPPGQ